MQLHAAYTTPPDDIAAVVARITTSPMVQQNKIIGGIDNEVHAVTTADGTRVVVHVRRHGELPFEDIAWALGQAYAAGVPVPQILLCDHATIDGAEREVMIQAALLGRPLDALLPTLDHAQLRGCYDQAAAALATIQHVPVAGFGMRRHGRWNFPDWEHMTSRLRPGTTERVTMGGAGLTAAELDRLAVALERLRQRFPCRPPMLIHGDFTPGHLYFDDALTLTGILDFGQFQGGSPIVDFDLMLPDLLELDEDGWGRRLREEYVPEGYGPTTIWEDFDEHRLLYAINELVTYFSYHAAIGDASTVGHLVERARVLLERLEQYA